MLKPEAKQNENTQCSEKLTRFKNCLTFEIKHKLSKININLSKININLSKKATPTTIALMSLDSATFI